MKRRTFIRMAGLGSVGVAALGAAGLAFRRTRLVADIPPLQFFTPEEYSVVEQVCARVLPPDPAFPGAHRQVAGEIDAFLHSCEYVQVRDLKRLLGLFDNALAGLFIAGTVRPFTRMDPEQQDAYLDAWRGHRVKVFRTGFAVLKRLVLALYYTHDETWQVIGYPGPPDVRGVLVDDGANDLPRGGSSPG